jgi:Raf kinase inhibitor-like YbhB/YbcL family protein
MRTRIFTSLLGLVCVSAMPLSTGLAQDPGHPFHLSSSTFDNNTFLPISAIFNFIPPNGTTNVCSIDGSPGGDQSPALSWTRPRGNTRSFVVILYDETAAFTHWGMYNISPSLRGLPQNAGVPGSKYGQQVNNDFVFGGLGGAQYDGPCPPPGLAPVVHRYVFTVYALDILLNLPSTENFPANAATLYQALVQAGEDGDILESASITGLYSTTPSH